METTTLNGKRAVKLTAKRIMWAVSKSKLSQMYDISTDKTSKNEQWIPNSVCEFIPDTNQGDPLRGNGDKKGKLIVEEWFYNKNIKI